MDRNRRAPAGDLGSSSIYSAAVSKLPVQAVPGAPPRARRLPPTARRVLLVTALLLTACTAGRTSGRAAAPAGAAAPARAPAPAPADPSVGLQRIQEATDLSGAMVGPGAPDTEATVLVVFATWCNPCRRELALLGKLAADTPRLRVLGLNAYEEYNDLSDEARLRGFLGENAPWLQVVRASEPLLAALGRPTKIPTLFVFDRHGALVQAYLRAQRRPPDEAELRAVVHRAMHAGAPARP